MDSYIRSINKSVTIKIGGEKMGLQIDFSQIFNMRNIIIYFIVINLIAFLAMWIDKSKAAQ